MARRMSDSQSQDTVRLVDLSKRIEGRTILGSRFGDTGPGSSLVMISII
jgi:hypothetical protein